MCGRYSSIDQQTEQYCSYRLQCPESTLFDDVTVRIIESVLVRYDPVDLTLIAQYSIFTDYMTPSFMLLRISVSILQHEFQNSLSMLDLRYQ